MNFSKRYMTSLDGEIRRDFEMFKSANCLNESKAIKVLIAFGLEKLKNDNEADKILNIKKHIS